MGLDRGPRWLPFGVRDLVDGDGLTRQVRLVAPHLGCLDQTRIGRYPVPFIEHEDVARHELLGRYPALLLVPDHAGGRGEQPFQLGHRSFGPVLLEEAEDAVQHDDRDDRDADGGLASQEGEGGARPQQQCEQVDELAGEPPDPARTGKLLDAVRPHP